LIVNIALRLAKQLKKKNNLMYTIWEREIHMCKTPQNPKERKCAWYKFNMQKCTVPGNYKFIKILKRQWPNVTFFGE
jgi:hypothetical protein